MSASRYPQKNNGKNAMQHFLIIEDVQETSHWLAQRLQAVWGNNIQIDTAFTLKQARRRLAEKSYDLALVDIGLPDGSGIQILLEKPLIQRNACYIITTIHDDDDHIFSALRAGAKGYLLKDSPAEDIENALHNLSAGVPPLSSVIATRIMDFFANDNKESIDTLTERERDVLTSIAQGNSVQDTAERMSISVHTARGYVKEIYRKLGISSRAEASVKASRMGLI